MQGRINFINLSRYSQYCERTFRRWFGREFDFREMNKMLLKKLPKGKFIIAIDAVVHKKSGKHTYGIGSFWSSLESRAIRGIELSCVALVHLGLNQAFAFNAKQTNGKKSSTNSRVDQYIDQLRSISKDLLLYSKVIVTDGFYVKQKFVKAAQQLGFEMVSKLRQDANLRYLHEGKQKKQRGRKRKFAGKFDPTKKAKLNYIKILRGYKIYQAILYSITLKQNINVVMICDKKQKYELLFSTNLTCAAEQMINYYQQRFQIELLFRDAKQHMGFSHCQSRAKEKLNFHYNLSLTAVGLAKVNILAQNKFQKKTIISIDHYKRIEFNRSFISRIISILEIKPNLIKKQKQIEKLINLGSLAA